MRKAIFIAIYRNARNNDKSKVIHLEKKEDIEKHLYKTTIYALLDDFKVIEIHWMETLANSKKLRYPFRFTGIEMRYRRGYEIGLSDVEFDDIIDVELSHFSCNGTIIRVEEGDPYVPASPGMPTMPLEGVKKFFLDPLTYTQTGMLESESRIFLHYTIGRGKMYGTSEIKQMIFANLYRTEDKKVYRPYPNEIATLQRSIA